MIVRKSRGVMGKRLLTQQDERILKEQIAKNSFVISVIIAKIDLLMNKEGHKQDSVVVCALQGRLDVLMAENDTFRKVYWKHVQLGDYGSFDAGIEAVQYLMHRVRQRSQFSQGSVFCETDAASQ